MWGNIPCDDYTNQDETEPFCSQKDVKDLFCDRFEVENMPLKWSRQPKDGDDFGNENRGRRFKYVISNRNILMLIYMK